MLWEIQIEADSPEEAAQQARAAQLKPDIPATVFDVRDYAGTGIRRVDVVGQADRLDRNELTAIRACLRLLQCAPDVHASVQEIAPVMLIFLDREEMMFKRVGRGFSR